ncbi:enoyl-CoA hydratase/isomerase family protein [Rhodobacteraceae bacterium HSP-20]|uniref:Enoyl-CoA hydratase/isomerase family protein n=1 Tax=Paragemmobacter amnigenus TaxID=2852097 RepID=A0ABS6J1Y5_9RHOB|nr:enoyl-CoA hydratase/isomerase family protein [Rhodobacter amnigenus]MBU9697774.1 enoyl-CoA hydratase/isomerase family protein [Rhodobacter amnigenus]MBV4389001.1 enoyl-CoA hydratase/isomerase family protein [Rhodobacter amnigenus]
MIAAEDRGGARVLVLDRADKANALTRAMLAELDAQVARAAAEGVAVLVITGKGKVFSAGADLEGMAQGLGQAPEWEVLSGRIAGFAGLTIAALNGTLAGGAFGMALACDCRVAVPGAEFFYPVMKRGYLPQPSDPKRLSALVGPSRAKQIILAGRRIGAEEARDWGLVDLIAEDAVEGALALAADALGAEPVHVRRMKAMF